MSQRPSFWPQHEQRSHLDRTQGHSRNSNSNSNSGSSSSSINASTASGSQSANASPKMASGPTASTSALSCIPAAAAAASAADSDSAIAGEPAVAVKTVDARRSPGHGDACTHSSPVAMPSKLEDISITTSSGNGSGGGNDGGANTKDGAGSRSQTYDARQQSQSQSQSQSQPHGAKNVASHLQTRLPPNSGSPSAAIAPSSFSSSLSSSPSPSPSINPYTGSLRTMLHGTRAAQSPPSSKAAEELTGAMRRFPSTFPANIRRSQGTHRPAAESTAPSRHALGAASSGHGPAQELDIGANIGAGDSADVHAECRQQRMPQKSPTLGIAAVANAGTTRPTQTSAAATAAGNPANRDTRCEQIVQNFYSKAAQIIAHLRVGATGSMQSHQPDATDVEGSSVTLPPRLLVATGQPGSTASADQASASSSTIDIGSSGRRLNKWFNLDLEDVDGVKAEVKFWRSAATRNLASPTQQPTLTAAPLVSPPPMYIEVCLDVSKLLPNGELQVTDIFGRPWTVDLEMGGPGSSTGPPSAAAASQGYGNRRKRASAIVLEVWRLDLATHLVPTPVPDLPRVYKQAIVFFRSLYSFANLLPCTPLIRQLHTSDGDLSIFCSFRPELAPKDGAIDLDTSLTGTEHFLESHRFEPIATPAGSFVMSVQYRRECSFSSSAPPDAHSLDSMAGIGAIDETYFTPTLSSQSGSNFSLPRHLQQPHSEPRHQQAQAQAAHSLSSKRRATLSSAPSRGISLSSRGESSQTRHSRLALPQSYSPDSQHRHRSSFSSERNFTVPSVNPFRAHPLSLGDSPSLPSYLGDMFSRTTPSRLSSDMQRASDMHSAHDSGKIAASKASLRRISLEARSHALGAAHGSFGNDGSHADYPGSRNSSVGSVRGHSLDQRAGSISRLSSSGGGAEAGSVLHRGVTRRRLGGSLSPTDSQRHHDSAGGASNMDTAALGSKSPPRTDSVAIRSSASGSVGSSGGRSVLAFVSPFKSPSLLESPTVALDAAMEGDSLAYPRQQLHDSSRQHGTAASYEPSLQSAMYSGGMQQLVSRVSESPSSLGSNASGHNRGLSSSFGNRRGSSSRRRSSLMAMTSAYVGAEALGISGDTPAPSRRHTVVEGQQWSDSALPGSHGRETGGQNIDDFIRMVDTRRPLKMFSGRESRMRPRGNSSSGGAGVRNDSLGSTPEMTKSLQQQQLPPQPPPSSVGPRLRSDRLAHAPPYAPSRDSAAAGYNSNVAPGSPRDQSLTRYQGILREFNGLSQDMQSSVLLPQQPLSTPQGTDLATGDHSSSIASSPFRRRVIPNPLKSAEGTSSSRPSSFLSVDTTRGERVEGRTAGSTDAGTNALAIATPLPASPATKHRSPPSSSAAEQPVEEDASIARLGAAFGGLSIDSRRASSHEHDRFPRLYGAAPDSPDTLQQPTRGHIRNAAAGLDSERERPLPKPVSIPRTSPGSVKQQLAQRELRYRAEFDVNDEDQILPATQRRSEFVRGKSQPTSHAPVYSPAAHRSTTPQPLNYQDGAAKRHHRVAAASSIAPPLPVMPQIGQRLAHNEGTAAETVRWSLDTGPFSHHSDGTSDARQPGALLGFVDDRAHSRGSPRSTPATPSPGVSAIFQPGGGLPVYSAFGENAAPSVMPRKAPGRQQGQASSSRRQDRLRSNFPPLSFIVPRSRMDRLSTALGDAAGHGSADRDAARAALAGDQDNGEVDDDDLMFQMDASSN